MVAWSQSLQAHKVKKRDGRTDRQVQNYILPLNGEYLDDLYNTVDIFVLKLRRYL